MKVSDLSGQTWRVSRRWVPWTRRQADRAPNETVLTVAAVVTVLLLFVAPLLVLGLLVAAQLLLFLLLLPLAAAYRLVFERHWMVEVRQDWDPWTEVDGGSWNESATVIRRLSEEIRSGDIPERTLGADPPG